MLPQLPLKKGWAVQDHVAGSSRKRDVRVSGKNFVTVRALCNVWNQFGITRNSSIAWTASLWDVVEEAVHRVPVMMGGPGKEETSVPGEDSTCPAQRSVLSGSLTAS